MRVRLKAYPAYNRLKTDTFVDNLESQMRAFVGICYLNAFSSAMYFWIQCGKFVFFKQRNLLA